MISRICLIFGEHIRCIGFFIELVVYVSLGVGIFNAISSKRVRFVCLAVKRCFDHRFIHLVIHSIFKIIQRVFCSECGISKVFIQFLGIQLVDVIFIRSDVRCILSNIGGCPLRSKRMIYFILRIDGHSTRRTALVNDLKRGTRYAQSPAEERKRHKRREKGTSSHPPNFFRACSRLRVRASDFRRYHIAILCFRPDDFVDVVHDDFPLCEKQ